MSDVTQTPAIGFTITCVLNQKRQINFQAFVPADCEPKELTDMLRKLHNAADIEEARYMLKDLELHLEVTEKQAKRIQDDRAHYIASLEDAHSRRGRRGDFEIVGKDRAHLDTLEKALQTTLDDKAKIIKNIEEYRQKVAA